MIGEKKEWIDITPNGYSELVRPLVDCGYKLSEIAIRRRVGDLALIGVIIAKPRPAWLLACRLWLAGKGL